MGSEAGGGGGGGRSGQQDARLPSLAEDDRIASAVQRAQDGGGARALSSRSRFAAAKTEPEKGFARVPQWPSPGGRRERSFGGAGAHVSGLGCLFLGCGAGQALDRGR